MKRLPLDYRPAVNECFTRSSCGPGFLRARESDIQQKIINNGVPESGFTLNIVPNDQADQPDAQVVGHCANDTFKILYTRTSSGNYPVSGAGTQENAPAEPQ